MASDVANTKKQVLRSSDPVSNLTFDVSLRRLRVAKNRAAAMSSGPKETQAPASGAPDSTAKTPPWRFPFSMQRDAQANEVGQRSQRDPNGGSPIRGRLEADLRRGQPPSAESPAGNAESNENVDSNSKARLRLPSFRRRGGAENADSPQPQPEGREASNTDMPERRFSFFRKQANRNSAQEEDVNSPDAHGESEVQEAQVTGAQAAAGQQETKPADVRTSVLTVDEAGSIRKLDGACPQQEFFSVSLSIGWQRKIPSRLQVHQMRQHELVERTSGDPAQVADRSSDGTDAELGNVVFTAAADDAFSQAYERDRRVCTSAHEQRLVDTDATSRDAYGDGQAVPADLHVSASGHTRSIVQRASSQQYQVFFILADLGWEQEDPAADPEHRLLLCVQAFKDGTIQLQPPVQTAQGREGKAGHAGGWRKLHDRHGGLYEYKVSIHTAGGGDDSISQRKQQLWEAHEREHVAHAHRNIVGRFVRPRGTLVVMCGEILSAGGFDYGRLYVEFALRFQSALWTLRGPEWLLEQYAALEGQFDDDGVCHVAGCTHISNGVWVQGAFTDPRPGTFVSHFCHPIEFQLELKESQRLPVNLKSTEFPTLYFEVHSMDSMLRSSPQGYCMLPLAAHCPCSATHRLQAWRPALSVQERVSEFYIGGAPALQNMSFVGYPADGPAAAGTGRTPLVKLATASESTGWLQVRTHCMLQYSDPEMHPRRRGMPALGQPGAPGARKAQRPKLETLDKIVQHAAEYIQHVTEHDPKGGELHRTAVARHTARLRQQRHVPDGGELTVLPAAVDALSRTRMFRPRIVVQPQDVNAEIGTVAEMELSVQAQGEELAYQWHKDGAPATDETATTARLVLSNPSVGDCGFYHVVVSNPAGSVNSARVHVIVKPVASKPLQPAVSLVDSPGRGGRAAARRRKLLASAASLLQLGTVPESAPPDAERIEPSPAAEVAPARHTDEAGASEAVQVEAVAAQATDEASKGLSTNTE
eukprot:jgi/Ulvmu1/562/UM001_0570.1